MCTIGSNPQNGLAAADCDEDGNTNADECNGVNGTPSNPVNPCDNQYTTGAEVCAFVTANPTTPLALADCDNGGIDNLTECNNGGDPTDPMDDCTAVAGGMVDICAVLAADPSNGLASMDCDGDGNTNIDECQPPGGGTPTDPSDPCSNLYTSSAQVCAYITLNPGSGLASADCDNGGIDNMTECVNGGDPLDESDDCTVAIDAATDICAILVADPTNPIADADCDEDGNTNTEECNGTNGNPPTNPVDPCDNQYGTEAELCAFITLNPTSMLATADCDGGGIDNMTECDNGNNPLDPVDDCELVMDGTIDVCAVIAADAMNPLASADCDDDGNSNADECNGTNGNPPSDPTIPCDNQYATGAELCAFVTANTSSALAMEDCDMGGIDNLTECNNGGDPLVEADDCDLVMNGSVDVCAIIAADAMNPLATADCDDDGNSNADECNGTNGNPPSDPTVPCDNQYTTGAELCAFVTANPMSILALADCDMGGIDNLTECNNGGDPLVEADDCDLVMNGSVDVCAIIAADAMNPLASNDCDEDGNTNGEECMGINGNPPTDPTDPCVNQWADDIDLCIFIEANPMSALALADCDMGGIINLIECQNGNSPTDPADDAMSVPDVNVTTVDVPVTGDVST